MLLINNALLINNILEVFDILNKSCSINIQNYMHNNILHISVELNKQLLAIQLFFYNC